MSDGYKVTVSVIEDTNYGDHGDRVRRDHEYIPGETVEELVERVFSNLPLQQYGRQHNASDVIELRVMVDRFGGVAAPAPPFTDAPPF